MSAVGYHSPRQAKAKEVTEVRPAPSDAALTPKQPRRAAGTPRHATHLSRAAQTA